MGDMSRKSDDVEVPEELFAKLSEADRQQKAAKLSQDIAAKYDPEKLSSMIVADAGRGEALDYGTRIEMERRLGGNFGNVRVFRGAFADTLTKAHNADAITVANTGMVMMRSGGRRSDPKTALGKSLLAHELTHVSQAQQGMHFALESGSQNEPHEQEAEAAESAVHADATGEAGGGGGKGKDEDDKKLIERVIEMVREAAVIRRERVGQD